MVAFATPFVGLSKFSASNNATTTLTMTCHYPGTCNCCGATWVDKFKDELKKLPFFAGCLEAPLPSKIDLVSAYLVRPKWLILGRATCRA